MVLRKRGRVEKGVNIWGLVGPPILIVSGPPAAGKSAFCHAFAQRFEKAVVIPVDIIRFWVVSGRKDTLDGWSDETERQFILAENAAVDVALRCQAAGFAVAIDHCRRPQVLEELFEARLMGVKAAKVALLPPLDLCLHRSETRTNKDFHHSELTEVIIEVHKGYSERDLAGKGWIVIGNEGSLDDAVEEVLAQLG